jgi:hypothetical protein
MAAKAKDDDKQEREQRLRARISGNGRNGRSDHKRRKLHNGCNAVKHVFSYHSWLSFTIP